MEFLSSGSLDHYLVKNKIDIDKKMNIIVGIARGMQHLEQEKIVHRDLAARFRAQLHHSLSLFLFLF